jgi:hypothetical protein
LIWQDCRRARLDKFHAPRRKLHQTQAMRGRVTIRR